MPTWLVTLLVAAAAASPGWLAYLNQRRALRDARSLNQGQDLSKREENAVKGFSALVHDLHQEIKRKDEDCERRVARASKENLVQIVRLEGQVEELQTKLGIPYG